jgi:phage/plasmid-associated DNA primase
MDKKRMVIFTEPNDSDYIQLGNVKTLTGDTTVNARGIYSKKTDTRILATIILECNKKPKINGRIDESAIARFINVLFPSTFTDDEEKLKLDNHHRINKKYKKLPKNIIIVAPNDKLSSYTLIDNSSKHKRIAREEKKVISNFLLFKS